MINANSTRVTMSQGNITGIRRESTLEWSLENACLIAKICESHRGRDTVVLDMTQVTPLFDFFVITTGNNRRQLRAIAESADDAMDTRQSDRLGREGNDEPWICHDYGDVVLHVFTPEARQQYDLENLWGDATKVEWQPVAERLAQVESD